MLDAPRNIEIGQIDGKELGEKKVEFDGGNFTIDYLSDSKDGFEVETKKSLNRLSARVRQKKTEFPINEMRTIAIYRKEEKPQYRTGEGFKPKIGIRNIEEKNGVVKLDIVPVTYPTYRAFSHPETEAAYELGDPTGTASVILTTEKDDSHKMILQHRGRGNRFYGDIPGASVAGMLDGKIDGSQRETRGKLKPISSDDIKGNLIKEMEEEIGLTQDKLSKIDITGIATDKTNYHHEILLHSVVNLSAEEMSKLAEERAKQKTLKVITVLEKSFS